MKWVQMVSRRSWRSWSAWRICWSALWRRALQRTAFTVYYGVRASQFEFVLLIALGCVAQQLLQWQHEATEAVHVWTRWYVRSVIATTASP